MSHPNGRPTLSEKGLLTPDNCVVAIIDLQPQMLFGVGELRPADDHQRQRRALEGRARVRRAGGALDGGDQGVQRPHVAADPGGVPRTQAPIERSTMNSWDDRTSSPRSRRPAGRRSCSTGLWTETCVALPTIQALHDGYEVYVVEDCCGDVSRLAHENAMKRVIQAGAKPVTALSVMLEWQRDWAHRGTYDAVMDIVKSHFGAYGIGVEYAYTMVHGAPATKFPEYVVAEAVRSHS